MLEEIRLSEEAVAVLRFEIKGWKSKRPGSRLSAYREMAEAGIMEPVPGSDGEYRFTVAGVAEREEVLEREAERIERERYEPPDMNGVSEAARALLGRIAAGETVEVGEENRGLFRELMAARVVMLGHTFARGRDSHYRFTYWGWKLRFDLLERACAKESA